LRHVDDPSTIDRRLHSNLARITSAMNHFRNTTWNGNTDIESGMRDGITVLTDRRSRNHAERIMILMTDGFQNVGSAMAATADCRSSRIVAHTITFGDFADQVTMRNVANATGGRHYHASTSAQLRTVFQELAAQLALLTD
jgi:Ca-activated chloride channel homolog